MVLLSGDIHIGCVHEVRLGALRVPSMYQMISSGITNDIGALMQCISSFLIRINRHVSTNDGSLAPRCNLLKGSAGIARIPMAD